MSVSPKIQLNAKLFLRDPEDSELGRKILQYGIILIHKIGFESFNFKKLATEIKNTEAGIYRYFENKHRLLIYIVDWYWSLQGYNLVFQTNNIKKPETKLKKALQLISSPLEIHGLRETIDFTLLYEIVMSEGAKSFLTKNVTEDNKAKLFKPYKDLCAQIAGIILECNPKYQHPHSLSSTIIEMAHSLNFYAKHLPSLTDFKSQKEEFKTEHFLVDLVFSSINKSKKNSMRVSK